MKLMSLKTMTMGLLAASMLEPAALQAQTLGEAITGGKVNSIFNLRYEGVDQDNALADASALTIRSAVKYTTAGYEGFSAVLEMEDVRSVLGEDDYTVGPSGFNPGIYSVIADPETTELNQGFLQYTSEGLTARLGRQVITHDSHRFIGSVPWRQDWQTYDAFSLMYDVNEELNLSYNYIDNRERIFAEDADLDSSDHLFRVAYQSPIGAISGYAYLLELDDVPFSNSLDTYGIRLSGEGKIGNMDATYLAEIATQESESGSTSFDAEYIHLVGGITFNKVTAKLGYEVLGSDNGSYGFSTPLATLHAFNGWADLFLGTPGQGLEDIYLNLSGKLLGGTLTAVFHDYSADESIASIDDFGSEFDLQFVRPLTTNLTLGIKYADYNDGDFSAKPDTQKFWAWIQLTF